MASHPCTHWINADYGIQVEVNSGIKNGDQVILKASVNLAEVKRAETIGHRTLGAGPNSINDFILERMFASELRLSASALDAGAISVFEEAARVF
jgi:hypothetical protein